MHPLSKRFSNGGEYLPASEPAGSETSIVIRRSRLWAVLRDSRSLWLFVVFAIAIATHAETLQYWFVATDTLPLIETSRVQSPSGVAELFTQPLMAGTDFVETALFYRPVSSLSYTLEYAVWGLSPTGYHLTNLLLHGVAAVLAAVTIAEITRRPAVGYLGAALFAIHPLTAGVVPPIARRQDVLLTVFVLGALLLFVRSRRTNSRRLLVGALGAYAAALGAKEPAVALPGIIFVWLVLYRGTGEWRSTLRRAVTGTAPFVAVTVAYALVRLVVLGGIGGYRTSAASGPGLAILFVPLKYLRWVFQPTDVVESVLTALPRSVLLVAVLGGAAIGLTLVRYARRRGLDTTGLVALVVAGIAVEGMLGVHLLAPAMKTVLPFGPTESAIAIGYLVDSLFIVGCMAGLLAAIRGCRIGDSSMRTHLVFFASWSVIVPGLLLATGAGIGDPLRIDDQIQTGYLCLVPAMAALCLLGLTAAEAVVAAIRSRTIRVDATVALLVLTVSLVLPLVVTSPLVVSNGDWNAAGQLNQQLLTELDDELDGTAADTPVRLLDQPTTGSVDPPHTTSVKRLQSYSFEAWFELQEPPQNRAVELVGHHELRPPYDRLSVEATRENGTVVVRAVTSG